MIHRHRITIDPRTARTVRVWLPDERPRAVLYLADGQNAFVRPRRASWRADEAAARLIAEGAIVPTAIVAIEAPRGAKRWEEYLPFPDPRNPRARRFAADRYADVVIPRIVREVARRHPEVARARHRAIGGSSYGAVAALHAAARHPGAFDRLLIESAPLWVGDGRLIAGARAARGRVRAWIGVGTAESSRPVTGALLVRLTRQLARALRERGDVRLRIVRGAAHHESAWAARFPGALRWLFAND